MVCTVCGNRDNRLKANYCKKCGKAFSDEERKEAYEKTVYGKIDKILEAKEWLTFSKITGNVFVRIAFLLILGALLFMSIRANGSKLSIQNSDEYSLAYCEETDEYYVMTDKESVQLSVYLPKKTDSCVIKAFEDGVLRDTLQITESRPVTVQSTENGYFTLRAVYENGSYEEVLFFVCREAE